MEANKKIDRLMWLTIGFSYVYFGYHLLKFLVVR